jgi:hypothetical protein
MNYNECELSKCESESERERKFISLCIFFMLVLCCDTFYAP